MTERDGHGVAAAVAARTERRWAMLSVCIVVLLIGLAAFAGIHQSTMPQARVETIDPSRLHLTGEFIESNLGTAVEPDGAVTVRAIGQQYSFTPQCILIPAGTAVTIRATSADVLHGLLVKGTNVNAMLVPGYVSVVRTRFDTPGEYAVPCQEYCGTGHQGMWGRIRVVEKDGFRAIAAEKRRLNCVE